MKPARKLHGEFKRLEPRPRHDTDAAGIARACVSPSAHVRTFAEEILMARILPDKSFYPSPALAGEAPPETLAYVALLAPEANGKGTHTTDALGVIDVNPASADYGRLVGKLDFP